MVRVSKKLLDEIAFVGYVQFPDEATALGITELTYSCGRGKRGNGNIAIMKGDSVSPNYSIVGLA